MLGLSSEDMWKIVGSGLHALHIYLMRHIKNKLEKYLRKKLKRLGKSIFNQNHKCLRFPAQSVPFAGCLQDDHGSPLRKDPSGAQLCYKALPHYEAVVQKRNRNLNVDSQHLHFLEGENQPIPISNEHELAHLYLGETYQSHSVCNIEQLDLEAILTIMTNASCFSKAIQMQAAQVMILFDTWMQISLEEC